MVETWRAWREARGPTYAAALAFYSAFAATPVLFLLIVAAGTIVSPETAERILMRQLARVVDPDVAALIRGTLAQARTAEPGVSAIVAGAAALIGAVGVFGQLRNAMNAMWHVEPEDVTWIKALSAQLLAFVVALGTGLTVIVLAAAGAALAGVEALLPPDARQDAAWLRILYEIGSLVIVAFLFAVLYRTLPAVSVSWRDVWPSAIGAAVLFQVGRYGFGIYLARSGLVSMYGAASSLAVLLMWLYYSAHAFLLGAELAHVRRRRRDRGQPRDP